jgi:hypothetical protein
MRIISIFVAVSLSLAACLQPNQSTSSDQPASPEAASPTTPETPASPSASKTAAPPTYQSKAFSNYWYAGLAELTGYQLSQSRYGEMHEGEAVLVFVTEPFSASEQVKLDNPQAAGEDKVNVLKLNLTKKFLTGIYPYSLMSSVFTPVQVKDRPYSLKVSTTSQEWCGHTYTQLNWEGPDYRVSGYSYFESEGDTEQEVKPDLLEDELWTRLRLDPGSIPTGEVQMLPSTMYIRLLHQPFAPQRALISRGDTTLAGDEAAYLRVYYPDHERELIIYYEASFPHAIMGWDEAYDAPARTGTSGALKTTARRSGTLKSPYWQQHLNRHRNLRRELGLSTSH